MTTYHHDTRFNRLCRAAFCWAVCLLSVIGSGAAHAAYSWTHNAYAGTFATAQEWIDTDLAAAVASNSACGYYVTNQVDAEERVTYTLATTGGGCSSVDRVLTRAGTADCVAGSAGFHRGVVAGEKVNPFNTCMNNCVTMVIPRLDLGVSVTIGTPVQTYATFELYRRAESCDSNTSTLPSLPAEGTTQTPPTPEPECPSGQRRAYFASGVPTCQPIPADRFCPAGYTYGTINGKDTCISQGNAPPTASSPATTDKTPSTESKESSTTTTNPDGSTTKTTTTSNGKGGGTTTTTTTSADGKTVESVTKKTGDDPEGKCDADQVGCMKTGTPNGDKPTKSDRTLTLGTGAGLSGFVDSCPADRVRQTAVGEVRLSFASACEVAPMVKPLVLLAAAVIAGLIVIQTLRS